MRIVSLTFGPWAAKYGSVAGTQFDPNGNDDRGLSEIWKLATSTGYAGTLHKAYPTLFAATSNDGRNATVKRLNSVWYDTFAALPGGLDHIMPQRPGSVFNGPQTKARYLALLSDPNNVGRIWGTTAAPTGPQVSPLTF